MKNLIVYINPARDFVDSPVLEGENRTLIKIQIDNSINLGWKKEDILVVTNFDYEYNGVKSLVIEDSNFCDFSPTVSKINSVICLFEKEMIENDLYWLHDLDAFQLCGITKEEIFSKLDNSVFGLTDYGTSQKWSTGSIFFTKDSKNIFDWIKIECYRDGVYWKHRNEEAAVARLVTNNTNNINDFIKKLNVTYNFAIRKRNFCLQYRRNTEKPIRVLHFHPFFKDKFENELDICMYGKNKLQIPFMTKDLINIFKKHGVE